MYDKLDLDLFFTKYYPQIPSGTYPILQSVDGGVAPLNITKFNKTATAVVGEPVLDLEVAYPIIYPQQIRYFQTGNPDVIAKIPNATPEDDEFDLILDAFDASFCTYEGGNNKTIDGDYSNLDCGTYNAPNVLSLSYGATESELPIVLQQRQCNEFMKLGLQGVSIIFSSGDTGVVPKSLKCLANGAYNPGGTVNCPYVTAVGATLVSFHARIVSA
jgi:tripeptidyl-peptidase I